jgi:hypothetical protein
MNSKDKKSSTIPSDISIDSLKIRIPIEFVDIIDTSIKSYWVLVHNDTSEVETELNPFTNEVIPKEYKKNSLTFKSEGITTRFAIEKQGSNGKSTREFLVILLNSKLLKSKYFDGITKNNIEHIFNELIAFNIFKMEYQDFIDVSYCTDVDFKKDTVIQMLVFQSSIKKLEQMTKPSVLKNQGCNPFNKPDNKGIEFSVRDTKRFISHPYFKIYHKQLELDYKSVEFSSKFLNNIDFSNVIRQEGTIKNAKHFRHLGIKTNSLKDILELDQETLQVVMTKSLKKHIEPRVNKIKTKNKLTPTEIIFYGSILFAMEYGASYESYRNNMLGLLESSVERSRKKQVLDDIYLKYIKGSNKDKSSKELDVFWNFLNI